MNRNSRGFGTSQENVVPSWPQWRTRATLGHRQGVWLHDFGLVAVGINGATISLLGALRGPGGFQVFMLHPAAAMLQYKPQWLVIAPPLTLHCGAQKGGTTLSRIECGLCAKLENRSHWPTLSGVVRLQVIGSALFCCNI